VQSLAEPPSQVAQFELQASQSPAALLYFPAWQGTLVQVSPLNEKPELQLVQLVAEPLQVAQGEVQALQTPGLLPYVPAAQALQVEPLNEKPVAQEEQVVGLPEHLVHEESHARPIRRELRVMSMAEVNEKNNSQVRVLASPKKPNGQLATH
jgi:hypothetical protein